MELRQKFVLLALIYALSLTANVALSAYCITVYIDSAFHDYQSAAGQEERLGRVRSLLQEQRDFLAQGGARAELGWTYSETQRQVRSALDLVRMDLIMEILPDFRRDFDRLLQEKHDLTRRWLDRQAGGKSSLNLPDEVKKAYENLIDLLVTATSLLDQERQARVSETAQVQGRVVTILVANTAGGALLLAVGVYFVRQWVFNPVGDLREATRELARGNFDYRIEPRSRDELGQLAREVNQMAGTIVEMQTQLIEQERLAAAGEMVTRLAHNIRNPLAGIRGLAETTIGAHPDDPDILGAQERIINTVDRFEKWLRDLQQSVSPLKLSPHTVAIAELLDGVMTALDPMLDRRGIKVEVLIDPVVREVRLDSLHFEQAVVALVTNAVQASQAGQTVRVRVEPVPQALGRWRLTVEDDGVGIPAELQKKIFLPYFTTKPEGNGIGLAMASKVVRLHGGDLVVESEVGRGSRFHITLSGLVSES
ncbi:MAG TPA: HAMP domain-containing sensor histidine kinase [Phycisphaerae bacterium]|nr:HAMP domain-containing sensor histidine kinase [Phycisphaerae bacterium]